MKNYLEKSACFRTEVKKPGRDALRLGKLGRETRGLVGKPCKGGENLCAGRAIGRSASPGCGRPSPWALPEGSDDAPLAQIKRVRFQVVNLGMVM